MAQKTKRAAAAAVPVVSKGAVRARRRKAPEERREEIFSAALELFSEVGYERATLNEIAARAGVSKGAVYHHFESKEALLIEMMRARAATLMLRVEALAAEAGGAARPDELLARLIEQMWAHYEQPGKIELILIAISELPKVPELARLLFTEQVARNRATIHNVLATVSAGGGVDESHVQTAALLLPFMIMGVVLGRQISRALGQKEVPAGEMREAVVRLLRDGAVGAGRA
ncbi:MAG TPA: helix-turn-helix domain-containing protein [Gemmatimonadaceae bacterium]|nr:helix-turn-helix domain-containing protein [Gemmatimonadaceae bacterium]